VRRQSWLLGPFFKCLKSEKLTKPIKITNTQSDEPLIQTPLPTQLIQVEEDRLALAKNQTKIKHIFVHTHTILSQIKTIISFCLEMTKTTNPFDVGTRLLNRSRHRGATHRTYPHKRVIYTEIKTGTCAQSSNCSIKYWLRDSRHNVQSKPTLI
jgi:hypothetical protein